MPARTEVLARYRAIGREEEPLSVAGGLKPLHASLTLAGGLV